MGQAVPHTSSEEGSSSGPTVESWSDADQRIIVQQHPAAGFLYDLALRAKIDADPSDVYQVLIDPRSHEIFRGIKATLSRTLLEDDTARGSRKLLIGHRALTKFLWISVTFDTELYVWEDDVGRTIRFANARNDGFMRQFEGTWRVQPFTQATLDAIYRPGKAGGAGKQQAQHQPHSGHHNWLGGILHHSSQQQQQPASTLVTLEQALAPKARPPAGLAHLVRGLCGRVLTNMMEDLRREVARRQVLQDADGGTPEQQQGKLAMLAHHSQQQQQQQQRSSSLPVASLSLNSSSRSRSSRWRGSGGSSSWCHEDAADDTTAADGVTTSSSSLCDLLAAALPLSVTIRL